MVIYLPTLSLCTGLKTILSIDRHIDFRKIYYLFYIRMGSVGCLAKGDIFLGKISWKIDRSIQEIFRNRVSFAQYMISAIIIEIFRKNIPISYMIPYKNLASPLIPVCLKKSHMFILFYLFIIQTYANFA